MTFKEKIFFLLGNKKNKIYKFSFFYFISSFFDLLSIGLIVPLITIFISGETNADFYFFNLDLFKINNDTIVIFLIILIVLFIFKSLTSIYIQNKLLKFCDKVQLEMSQKLFNAIQNMSYKDFISAHKSLYIDGIGKWPGHFAQRVVKIGISTIGEFIITTLMISVMFYTNWKVTLIIFFVIIFFTFIYDLIFKKKVSDKARLSNYHSVGRTKVAEEAFGNMKGTKIYNLENFFSNLISKHIKGDLNVIRNVAIINLIPRQAYEIIAISIILVVFFISSQSSLDISNIFAQISVFAIAGLRLKPFSEILSLGLVRVRSAKDSMERIIYFLNKSNYMNLDTSANNSYKDFKFEKLLMSNLSFKYNERKILENVNFEIKKNDFIGITGASGSGKSTFVDLITGFLNPTDGKIFINKEEIDLNRYYFKKKIAYITQDAFIMDDNLEKNITLGISEHKINLGKVEKIIDLLKIENLRKQLLNENESIKDKIFYRKISLSGGEKQLIAIARALYFDREILILDESTNSLDEINTKTVFTYLNNIRSEKTIIVISHQKNVLKYCNKVYNLENKKLYEIKI